MGSKLADERARREALDSRATARAKRLWALYHGGGPRGAQMSEGHTERLHAAVSRKDRIEQSDSHSHTSEGTE